MVRVKPALLLRQQSFRISVGAESRSDTLEKDVIRVCYELYAVIVPEVGPVLLFVQTFNDAISPSLQYLPLMAHQLDRAVKLPKHGRVTVQPEFEEFDWEFI